MVFVSSCVFELYLFLLVFGVLKLRQLICISTLSLKHFVVRQQEIQATALAVYEFLQSVAYFTVQCSCANINDFFSSSGCFHMIACSLNE